MLKHLKLVSGLMFVLGLLLTLQCVSGSVFFTALEGNRAVRNTLIDHEHAQTTLDASWSALLQTRISLSRAGTRLVKANTDHVAAADLSPILDDARRTLGNAGRSFASFNNQPALEMPDGDTTLSALQDSFQQYHLALQALINYLQDKDVSPFLAQPTQSLQDNFETAYDSYKQHAAKVIAANLRAGNARYRTSLWALGIAIALMVVAILLVWRAATAMFIRPLKKITHHIHLLANGDLTASLDIDSHNEIGVLASQLRRMQVALEEIVTSVREGANAIHAGTHEGSVRNQDLSSRTEQQAAALEETAASMDQITAMARQNAANAEQARQLATETSSSATESGVLVGDVIATMNQIATSAQKMANIIGVVDNIAFQTNMLALNAAVEAARAGEHGRGFAIVAGEVRNLAQSSAQAAKEIKQLIDDSGTQVDAGASQVRVANDKIEGVITAVGRVNTIISDIALASDEQSRGIDQVNTAVVEMDNVTQQNASLVEESAASSKILEEQAQALNDAVSVFKVKH